MDPQKNELLKNLICEIKNANFNIEVSTIEAQECITALKQRFKKLKKIGAKKEYLYEIYKLIKKFEL